MSDAPSVPTGWRRWLSFYSPLDPVWLWHAMFDGTWLCRCTHSRWKPFDETALRPTSTDRR